MEENTWQGAFSRMLTGSEIRRRFLEYFARNGHEVVPSASLVPYQDPTLLFTNAGMVPFKNVFLGLEKRPYTRATSCQRSVRAGGKHNDLDSVGRTARHHTFFEMLGNFSFGDYFKKEAIALAWTFLTEELGLERERLWVSVFEQDDEAYHLWREGPGVAPERIVRLGEKDNFWQMGDTGPCGPCSEIYVDRGEDHRCAAEVCALGVCDCDRWLEVWNLVFMQFDRLKDGTLVPLPRPSIDTGMGLERIASVLQGAESNFDTDLFRPLIGAVERLAGLPYDRGPQGFPFRVIADHARSGTFLVSDGVMPGNEGRGYVLRRILRRALRIGRQIGLRDPFLYRLVPDVVAEMGRAYPELVERQERIVRVIREEEERFAATLEQGLALLSARVESLKAAGARRLAGEDAFVLQDTYGFPVDLTMEILEAEGLDVDLQGFEEAMTRQRERARADRADRQKSGSVAALLEDRSASRFVGYETLSAPARVLGLTGSDHLLDAAGPGEQVGILLDVTPFYGEGGGQVGDRGLLTAEGVRVRIEETLRLPGDRLLHQGVVEEGVLESGSAVLAAVDEGVRRATARNHTATHLLHAALRRVLGEHVSQAGSLVTAERLRFDFTHPGPLSPEELERVAVLVNREILADHRVETAEESQEEARRRGAMALFGEKYGDVVRTVAVAGFSLELCGGTHVQRTGEIGLFAVVEETGIGASLRRIEAVTGEGVLALLNRQEEILGQVSGRLKTDPATLSRRVEDLLERLRGVEAERDRLRQKVLSVEVREAMTLNQGQPYLLLRLEGADAALLRQAADIWRAGSGPSRLLAVGERPDGIDVVLAYRQEEVKAGRQAGKDLSALLAAVGGRGGGRPEMAQGGFRVPGDLTRFLEAAATRLQED